jgi:phytoene dehydrogenase-like protein
MASSKTMRAAIIGSGPNGLAAAISLAEAGCQVRVFEAAAIAGGATRTGNVTLPGFRHDLGSAIHPLAVASPFFAGKPLHKYGLDWIHPDAPLAHPLDDGTAVMLEASIEKTSAGLDSDRQAYVDLLAPLVESWPKIRNDVLAPARIPAHPFATMRFGVSAATPASWLCRLRFRGLRARALFAGMAAHSTIPLSYAFSSAIGLVLGIAAHTAGWPLPKGGACGISESMIRYLESLGGSVELNHPITDLADVLSDDAVLCDLTPRQFARIASEHLTKKYQRSLNHFHYGPGVFKMDWALSQPIPWTAKECLRAATVHIGGRLEEIEASERAVWNRQHTDRPFVLLAQPSLFDSTRAPRGKHTAWAYCRVPNGSRQDLVAIIESQIERFAPGFRDCILARKSWNPQEMECWDANLIGGDIGGGALTASQLFLRPDRHMYSTPIGNVFLCSSSTPPGPGVHGMCGFHAAERAKRLLFRDRNNS